ncbi:hypothetical protein GW750_06320 [bacterium]|nr:hypothetical protein [bacterium]
MFPCTQKTKNKHFNELSLDEVFYASEQFDEALKRKHAAKKEVLKDDYSKRFYDNILEQYK